MTRSLCILTGFILTLSPFSADQIGRNSGLDLEQMTQGRGGDPTQFISSARCDAGFGKLAPFYVGCQVVGGPCQQCVNAVANPDGTYSGSTFELLKNINPPSSPGNQTFPNNPAQNCGVQFIGTCIVNPNPKPGQSNFTCLGKTGAACTTFVAVGQQPFPPPQ